MTANRKFRLDPISVSLRDLPRQDFDVIVVGSGYGGSIAASRLSRAGRRVCLLERGREVLPGAYPNTLAAATAEVQVATAKDGWLSPGTLGMMELRISDDMTVISGCGLGGGSLVNANVAIIPQPDIFDASWPAAYAGGTALTPYFARARDMLGITTLPRDYLPLPPKFTALDQSARAMGLTAELADIAVTFEDGFNAAGIYQAACTRCGDCCSGCNYGAKNTLLMNYLPDAHRHGAVIVTRAAVQTVLPDPFGGWVVAVEDLSGPGAKSQILTSSVVVIAAGALGSTELLFRSHRAGLPLAQAALGTRFSGNGDILGFGVAANLNGTTDTTARRPPIYSFGAGSNAPDQPPYQPGPCITGIIKVNWDSDLSRAMVIEDGVGPGALASVYPALLFLQDAIQGGFLDFPDTELRLADFQALGTAVQGGGDLSSLTYTGLIARTQSYLVMSHDTSGGKLEFNEANGLVSVNWPGDGRETPYPQDNAALRKASEAIWANYVANPLWLDDFGRRLVTVHPIGGCPMSDSPLTGVVDGDCRVYTGTNETVHSGLLVCDGSVLPSSLGVNPLYTISAVAERAIQRLIDANGWTGSTDRLPPALVPVAPPPEQPSVPVLTQAKALVDWAVLLAGSLAIQFPVDADRAKARLKGELDALAGKIPSKILQDAVRFGIEQSLDACNTTDMALAMAAIAGQAAELSNGLGKTDPLAGLIAALDDIFGDAAPTISFRESMSGWCAVPTQTGTATISDRYAVGEAVGKRTGQQLAGRFQVIAAQADALAPPEATLGGTATLQGTVTIGGIADGAGIPLTNGRFTLFRQDLAAVETWTMDYIGDLGTLYHFKGTKTLQRKPGSGPWRDLTTLCVDLEPVDPDNPATPPLTGIIRLGLQDLANQASSIGTTFQGTDDPFGLVNELFTDVKDGSLCQAVQSRKLLHTILMFVLSLGSTQDSTDPSFEKTDLADAVAALSAWSEAAIASLFGRLIFRTYGGLPAYLADFPAQDDQKAQADGTFFIPCDQNGYTIGRAYPSGQRVVVPTLDNRKIALYRFEGGKKGPVILAPGFAMTALSYGMLTNSKSFLTALLDADYDVWLFDNRSSPISPVDATQTFTLDQIVDYDWPAAVATVQAQTGAASVQIMGHCVGAMTAQMAVLAGRIGNVRQMILSQLTVHPVPNWFNQMKADTRIASSLANGLPAPLLHLVGSADPDIVKFLSGLPVIDAVSRIVPAGSESAAEQAATSIAAWRAPFAGEQPCYSPTCHRIFGIYGPILLHANLNEATHTGLRSVFGAISTHPFEQLGLIMQRGHAVRADGADTYLPGYANVDFPIHMIHGALNQEFLPDTTWRTQKWLRTVLPTRADEFTRTLIPGYAHLDCFIGRRAHLDVFPALINMLDKRNTSTQPRTPA